MADAPLSSNEVADSRKPSCRYQSEVWVGDCDLCQKDCHVEIERLTASLAEANASANHLTAERDRLRAALKEYGIHLQPECSDGCVCGLDKDCLS